MNKYGYVNVKGVSPCLHLGNPLENAKEMVKELKQATKEKVEIVNFPELGLTGYTCDDLFHQSYLINETLKSLEFLLKETSAINILFSVGLPIVMDDSRIYNAALICYRGKIIHGYMKKHLPNYKEFYDLRYFASGKSKEYSITICGQKVTFGDKIIKVNCNGKKVCSIGVSICEDDWAPDQNAVDYCINGADIVLNLSASNELVAKSEYRKQLISQLSARTNCIYLYSSAGAGESTKDTVFGGHCFIVENGEVVAESKRFELEETSAVYSVDLNKIENERKQNTTYGGSESRKIESVTIDVDWKNNDAFYRNVNAMPFVPSNELKIAERAEEIFEILSTGTAQYLKKSGLSKFIMGLSGGMDSTLVALIAMRSLKKLNKQSIDLITISMPGFGTSDRTKGQSELLAKVLNTTHHQIDITKTVKSHFDDINHKHDVYDIAFENAQARERTQIILDMANMHNGLMLGTGSLSEIALGFSTFGGDQICHLNPIGGCPKSLSKFLIRHELNNKPELKDVLERVLGTTISPELLPTTDKTVITQSSEDFLGNYDVIDFCLYHHIKNGFTKDKIKFLLKYAYRESKKYDEQYLENVVEKYFDRFYKNQFKRTMMPQSIKLGLSLSPRADWRMPDTVKYQGE